MKLSEYAVDQPYSATLVASERITPKDADAEVRHLVLQLPDDATFAYTEGQSIGVLAPGPHDFGNSQHLRLYSIASSHIGELGADTISICVRRCFYVDEVSGERYPGKASNYLCDAVPGDRIQITGPYGAHFTMPPDTSCNMLMVGVGTGIAPFRAFVKNIHDQRGAWKGRVRLFYGAKSGMEMLYVNEFRKDLALYYDDESFQAFEAVSPRPAFDAPPALDSVLLANAREVWSMIQAPNTYVYVAGLSNIDQKFEKAMTAMAGSKAAWMAKRDELNSTNRYAELLYD